MGLTSVFLVRAMLMDHPLIVCNLNVVGIALKKSETDAPWVVDGDRVLTFAVTTEPVKPIPRGNAQVSHLRCQINVLKPSPRSPHDGRRQPLGPTRAEQLLCVSVRKGLDHSRTITCHVTLVKPQPLERRSTDAWHGVSPTRASPTNSGDDLSCAEPVFLQPAAPSVPWLPNPVQAVAVMHDQWSP